MAPADSTEPLLSGRERELGVLRASLETALDGRGTLVLIGGEAGIGKTTLAEALCAEAADQGVRVLVGRCYDLSETPPYGPWIEAFGRSSGGMGLPALPTALLPPERSDGEAVVSQDAIIRRVQNYLTALANRRPLLLLLEDLHWADPASLDLLRVVARELGAVSLLILATYRADELTGRHPLAQLLPLLVREARAERLDLRPLDEAAIGALVASRYALDTADAGRLVAYLAAHADGNPLFLGELLRTLEGEGSLARGTLGNLDRVPVPELLQQVIAGRLARLDEATQHLLALAATIGQVVPLDLWAAVGEVPEEALLPHIERATGARILIETPDGTAVRFVHALVREVLYQAAPAIRRRAWHRRVGEALAARPASDPDAVAYHLRQAGDERAVEWLVRASERAVRAYAYIAAADRVEAALALLEQRGGDLAERGWLSVQLARLFRFVDQRRALGYAEQALALAGESDDRALVVYAQHHLSLLRCRAGQLRAGIALMASSVDARAALSADDQARLVARRAALGDTTPPSLVQGSLANWLAVAGRYAEATALATPLLPQGTTVRDGDHALCCFALGQSAANFGQVDEGARWFAEARAICRATGEYFGIGQYAFMQLLNLHLPYRADQPDEREHLALEAAAGYRLAAGAVRADVPSGLERLPLLFLSGGWGAAWELALAVRAGDGMNTPNALLLLGPLALARGETALAGELVRETLPAGPATEPGDCWFRTGLTLQRVAATLALAAGDFDTAHAWLAAHDRWLAWNGALLGRAEGQLGWVAYHRAIGDFPAAHRAAAQAHAAASAPRQPLALLAAHRALGELDTAANRHAAAHAHLDAALALAEACAAPYERALTHLALAELRAAEYQPDEAWAALDHARALLAPLGAAPALARADAIALRLAAPSPAGPATGIPPFGLTARELDVLRLLAEGLTDPQIAERLFVSRNTVNSHLRAIYGKLGVNTRTAAARLATERDLA